SSSTSCHAPGEKVELTAVPTAGFGLLEWMGDASGTSNPLTITMDGPKTIVARFVGYPLTASVSPAGTGSVEASPAQPTYAPGSTVTLTAHPSNGFEFLGWGGDASGSDNPLTVTMDGPKNVTARFNGYTLTIT